MTDADHRVRARILVRGAVQGVGFRPCIHRLATRLALGGWVRNDGEGVVIEVEGGSSLVQEFVARLERDKPPLALIRGVESRLVEPEGVTSFTIVASGQQSSKAALILPDVATCPDCLRELFDPTNRRFRHPFINCTNCGPRFSIIEALPYDRPNTSMKQFAMCEACEREYHDPANRRFHAQPTACPACGPQLSIWDGEGSPIAQDYFAVEYAAAELRRGGILAFKGIGGFQLLVDARNEEAVRRLRTRKHREEKPLAVMVPGLETACAMCDLAPAEQRLLASPQAPVVLLRRRADPRPELEIAPSVAPRNPYLGVMLPYSPQHHLLLGELGFPVVATSGNLTDEPICTDQFEALERLRGIADAFLVHDRPIVRYVDDSVVRVMLGEEQILRRARGYAPLPVRVGGHLPKVLALGAHLKNTVALGCGSEVFVSQHIGDLETEQANEAFRRIAGDLPRLYDVQPEIVACDLHPEYQSTVFASRLENVRIVPVQHHRAHVVSCMAENGLEPPVLGVSWDGTGLGEDGTIWGGEFLVEEGAGFRRVAHLHPFRLPGGEAAIREPRRCALGVLHEAYGEQACGVACELGLWRSGDPELGLLRRMLDRGVQSVVTTSAGRLFDAVAALAGVRQKVSFEGQAAIELEFVAEPDAAGSYRFELEDAMPLVADWRPIVRGVVEDVRSGTETGVIAGRFHRTLAALIGAVAQRVGLPHVVLTGGCFQNRLLTEGCVRVLEAGGFRPAWHRSVPPNDGGISLGQAIAAVRAVQASSGTKDNRD